MKKDIEHNRLLSIQNKINIKNKEKEEDAIMLQKYLDNMKIQEQKEKDNILNHKLKEKDINIYRLKQIQDKKNNAINQFNDLQQQYYNNQLLLQKDKDDFLDYAQNQINIYKNNGKNITPLMLELKLYRKKGLI